jgi:putative ABC transport system permease protein
MILNYLLSAHRFLVREGFISILHISGLAIGLAASLAISAWVIFETSYDKSLDPSGSLYRVVTLPEGASGHDAIASTYPMVRSRILSQFPEVAASTRLFDEGFLGSKTRIKLDGKIFTDSKFYYGDDNFLTLFPFEMVSGDRNEALKSPNSVVITRSTAKKFFGDAQPMGKVLTIGDGREFQVTAIIEDIPANVHFHFDLLASMQSHPWIRNAEVNVWSGVVFHTYVSLSEGASPSVLEQKIRSYLDNFPGDPKHFGRSVAFRLQPVNDIHLKSHLKFELEPGGNIMYVYLFVTIGLMVLGLAIINYINLATARHAQRFREIGVRKSLGASRLQLVGQFMTESVLTTFMASVMAFLILVISGPRLINILGATFSSQDLLQPPALLAAAAIVVLTILATGLVPAVILSNYRPLQLLRGNSAATPGGLTLRKVLLISQFGGSMALTICTLITSRQVHYIKDMDLGYDRMQIVVLDIGFPELFRRYDILKSSLLTNSSILGATATSQLPSDIQTGENIDVSASRSLSVNYVSVDHDFFDVMDIDVNQGGDRIKSLQESDSLNHFAFNQSAVDALGWRTGEVLNQQISIRHGNMRPGPVMAVFDNFHFHSLHRGVEPLVVEFDPQSFRYLLIKVNGSDLPGTIQFIASRWKEVAGGIPFEYQFLDQEYNNLYISETKSNDLLTLFAGLAQFISVLGLFGLTSFAVQRRTKEIAMRKVLGARVAGIVMLIGKEFVLLLVISFVVATVAGYLFMRSWLAGFAFRTDIGPGLFMLAGALNFLLAIATISIHSLKIAATKPVDALGQE